MTDYAAAALQPIAQGLVSITGNTQGGVPTFYGRGISSIARTVGGSTYGDFTLTLDAGLPGDVGVDPNHARARVTIRGGSNTPANTTITQTAVSYPSTNTIRVLLSIAGTGTDPVGAAGLGFELVVFRGNAGPAAFQETFVGPLYQNVTIL